MVVLGNRNSGVHQRVLAGRSLVLRKLVSACKAAWTSILQAALNLIECSTIQDNRQRISESCWLH